MPARLYVELLDGTEIAMVDAPDEWLANLSATRDGVFVAGRPLDRSTVTTRGTVVLYRTSELRIQRSDIAALLIGAGRVRQIVARRA